MGTTWLFNVIKEITAANGLPTAVVADNVAPPELTWNGSVIIKAHRADSVELINNFDSKISLQACAMVRDAIPTFRSLIRTQSVERGELLAAGSRVALAL